MPRQNLVSDRLPASVRAGGRLIETRIDLETWLAERVAERDKRKRRGSKTTKPAARERRV